MSPKDGWGYAVRPVVRHGDRYRSVTDQKHSGGCWASERIPSHLLRRSLPLEASKQDGGGMIRGKGRGAHLDAFSRSL